MSIDLCGDGFFARLTREEDTVTVQVLARDESAEARLQLLAEFRCGLDELVAVLTGYTLQLSNDRGDFLLASPDPGGVNVAFTVGDRSRACVVERAVFGQFLLGQDSMI
ncbi:MAG: hypothetical protein QOJ65_1609 [Fimbriimonadaceae bacterium]|jgi:hypothetical protein|nr:hypothetical protein [Fimbriimonadaceae bacterium]